MNVIIVSLCAVLEKVKRGMSEGSVNPIQSNPVDADYGGPVRISFNYISQRYSLFITTIILSTHHPTMRLLI